MATGPSDAHHGARDTGEEWRVESRAEEAGELLYHDVEEHITRSFKGGKYTSSTAQRRPTPGYTKRETTRLQKIDWSDEAIVSPFLNTLRTYTAPRRPSLLAFTQALCQLPTLIVFLHFLFFTVIHFYCQRAFDSRQHSYLLHNCC